MTKKKLKKELVDQSLHFLWAAATLILPFAALRIDSLPGWATIVAGAISAASLLVLVTREILQKKDKPGGILHHWPWLDFTFYSLGAAAGLTGGLFLLL